MQAFAEFIPKEQKNQMSLSFNSTESLYKASERDSSAARQEFDNGNVQVQTIVMGDGAGEEIYINHSKGNGLKHLDMMGQQFLISFDLVAPEWKVEDEQKEILGYTCIKATSMNQGNEITAWFTPQIPLSIGPDSFVGLPGAILALELNSEGNEVIIAATEINLGALKTPIEQPTKGKKVTEEEFQKVMDKRLEMMNQHQGGGSNIIISTDH